jgi:hypothetical protein
MAACALAMAAKAYDVRCERWFTKIVERFPGLEVADVIQLELDVFTLIERDVYFPTSLHFVQLFLQEIAPSDRPELFKVATVVCLAAAELFECRFLMAEELGGHCFKIAQALIENGYDLEKIDVSEPGRAEIVQHLRLKGMGQFLSGSR